jgi:Arc/MetJ family transcription regulator
MNKATLIRIDEELLAKVDAEAQRDGRSRNNFINHVLRRWCDADAVTIENARDRRTIDLDTLIGPGPSLDWGMDPNARLVDPGVAYETEEAE